MSHSETSLIHLPGSIVDRLDVAGLFSSVQPLEVELGSGDGSFIAQYAALRPECNFIAVERLLGRLRKIDRKGRRSKLGNLRCLRLEASYVLEHMLPRHSASAIHIYFPDPWPKRKHRKHRLVNEQFPPLARMSLAPGGAVYLRTDDADYFAQMKWVFGASALFSEIETPGPLAAVLTDFERGFLAKGIQTLRAAYRAKE